MSSLGCDDRIKFFRELPDFAGWNQSIGIGCISGSVAMCEVMRTVREPAGGPRESRAGRMRPFDMLVRWKYNDDYSL